jgi:PST family polysaccharide transporter
MQVAVSTYTKVRDDRARLGRAFDLVQYVVVRVVPLAGLALALYPEDILRAMYGARWAPAAPALRVMGIYAVLGPVLESYRSFAVAMEQWRSLRWSVLAQGALLVASLALLAPRYGIVGAAWGTCSAPIAGLVVLNVGVTRHLVPSRHGVLGPVCVAMAVALAAGLGLQRLVGAGGAPALLLKLSAAATVYGLVLLLIERRSLLEHASYLRARAAG